MPSTLLAFWTFACICLWTDYLGNREKTTSYFWTLHSPPFDGIPAGIAAILEFSKWIWKRCRKPVSGWSLPVFTRTETVCLLLLPLLNWSGIKRWIFKGSNIRWHVAHDLAVSNWECRGINTPSTPLCVWLDFYQTIFSIKTRLCTYQQTPPQMPPEQAAGVRLLQFCCMVATRSAAADSWPRLRCLLCFVQPQKQIKKCCFPENCKTNSCGGECSSSMSV